jgi:basic membrane protein A and related proteins
VGAGGYSNEWRSTLRFSVGASICVAVIGVLAIVSCGKKTDQRTDSSRTGTSARGDTVKRGSAGSAGGTVQVGLILDKGGKDDKSFNSAAFLGASEAVKEGGVELKDVETMDDALFEPNLRALAERGFDLVIGIGFAQREPIERVAKEFPNIHFAIVDAEVDLPNVASLLFDEHEGSFLVGAIAAGTSETGTIGFVGGMDVPLIRRFEMGYSAGAKYVRPDVKVLSNFVGVTSDAWNNPTRGKELAQGQYRRGADVIFAAAGASGLGVFDAAEEMDRYVIGVDSNQNWLKPGFVLTSMLKRVDRAVYEVIQEARTGRFRGGVHRFTLANEGIDFSLDEHNEAILLPRVQALADSLKKEIVAGRIDVPDYYLVEKRP